MVQVAGRLKHFVQQWYNWTSDQTILDTAKHCHIEFVSDILPYQEIPKRPIKMSLSEQNIMNTEVSKLLNKGVIEQCAHHIEAECISNVFLKNKQDASYRMRGGAGVNHVKRDWHEIFNVNCDLYLFFCVKRDWGYLRET